MSSAASASASASALPPSCSPAVHILDISSVKPAQPTPRFRLRLSYADSVFVGAPFSRNVLFFPHPPGELDLQALKHGLSAALVPFYPLAGRLHCSDDVNTGRCGPLFIDCSDAGVEFVEAVTDLDFAQLEEQHFPICHGLVRFSSRREAPPDPPLLSIQVTRFRGGCGTGIAIGVAVDHVAADGHSIFHFLRSWGECCRGQAMSLPPLHVRSLMEPECWGFDKYSTPRFRIADLDLPAPPPAAQASMELEQRPPGAMYCKVMHFDRTIAQQLKQTAIAESGNPRISTFQAVLACVWKRICAAQDLPSDKEVRMHMRANMRQLILPSLTDAYFGNALQRASASATAGEVERESVGWIAARINESLTVLKDQAHLQRELQAMEENFCSFLRGVCDGSQRDVLQLSIGQGTRLPVFDVDVGMGKPAAVRPAVNEDVGFDLQVFRGREEGSIDIFVQFATQRDLQAFLSIPCPCIDI